MIYENTDVENERVERVYVKEHRSGDIVVGVEFGELVLTEHHFEPPQDDTERCVRYRHSRTFDHNGRHVGDFERREVLPGIVKALGTAGYGLKID